MEFRKITSEYIKEYRNEVLKNSSASTFDRKIFSLKKFFDWALSHGLINENPVESFIQEEQKNIQTRLGKIEKERKSDIPSYDTFQARIVAKLAGKPKLQKLAYNIFYTRPKWYKTYHKLPIATYFNYAILVILMSGLAFGVYNQFFKKTATPLAYPTSLTAVGRYLSFQGRLTTKFGNPITSATDLQFKLYNASESGSLLWDSGTCSITPDTDGIFSTLLGSSCGGGIDSSVFSENAAVWLGVTVGADTEAEPRVQIATVAYALNSETLQGYPASSSATANTVPVVNNLGQIVLAVSSPKIQSTSGNFAVEGQTLTFNTPTGSNGSINIAPDGTGSVNLTFSGASAGNGNGMLYATDANLTSDALIYGSVTNDASGYNLLELASGDTPRTKFAIDSYGNATMSGTINGLGITSGTITSGAWNGSVIGTLYGGTGANNSGAAQYSIPYYSATGVLGGVLTPGTSGYVLSTNDSGGAPNWIPMSAVGTNDWAITAGAIHPGNTTLDLLIGSSATASAKFAFKNVLTGTPTASISGSSANTAIFIDGDGNISTTNRGDLVLGNSSTYNSTGNILFNPNGTGNVGVGNISPDAKLAINNTPTTTGPELISNVTFTGDATGWNLYDGAAYDTNNVTVTNGGYMDTSVDTVSGNTYLVTFTLSSVSNDKVFFGFGNNSYSYFDYGNGTHSVAFTSDFTGTDTIIFQSVDWNSPSTWTIDNVSVKEATVFPSLKVVGYDGITYLSLGKDSLRNTAIGGLSLYSNTTGIENTSLGYLSLYSNTTGWHNSAIGSNSLSSNTEGSGNTALGSDSLKANTTGYANSAVGYESLVSNTTGFVNSGFGNGSLQYNTEGYGNSAFGSAAINGITTGYYNSAVGYVSGLNLTTGIQNTFIGAFSGSDALQKIDAVNSIALGYQAYTTADNQVVIGNNSITQTLLKGNVGIGTTSPSQKLDVSGNFKLSGYATMSASLAVGNTTALAGPGNINASGRITGAQIYQGANQVCDTSGNCGGGGQWTLANGALSPNSSLVDVLIGGTATTSAKFAFKNVMSGVPTASVSGSLSGASLFMDGNGNISTTNKGNLVLGNSSTYNSTGNILLNPNGIGLVGIGTTTPQATLHVAGNYGGNAAFIVDQTLGGDILTASASGQTKMTLANDGTLKLYNATSSISNTSGDITLNAASGLVTFSGNNIGNIFNATISGVLNAGGLSQVAYNAFAGVSDTPGATAIATSNDLFVGGDLELKGGLYLTGRNIFNVVGGVSTGAITLATTPTATDNYNALSYGSWLINNNTNPGIASLMVNQSKGTASIGDIFTASASGATKFTIHNDSSFTMAGLTSAPTNNTTPGTIYFNTTTTTNNGTTGDLFVRGEDNAWHRVALDMTSYSSNNNSLANGDYVTVTHNQNTNDLDFSGWVYDTLTSTWKSISTYTHNIIQNLQNQFDMASPSGKIRVSTVGGYSGSSITLNQSAYTGNGADGAITVSSSTNVNTTTIESGRSCADGGDQVNYSVTSLTSTTATLSTTPSAGCLAAGDEVLLINLQGVTTAYGNVGNYETLRLATTPASSTITFATSKTKYYGDTTGIDDSNIGTGATNQKVIIQRVPNYSNVTINGGVNMYPSAWNGTKGGVLFFRANGIVTVNGSITTAGLGYRGGTGGGGYGSDQDSRSGGLAGEGFDGLYNVTSGGSPSVTAVSGGGRAAREATASPNNGIVTSGGGGGGNAGAWGMDEVGGSGGGGGNAGGGGGGAGGSGSVGISYNGTGGTGGTAGVSAGGGGGATNATIVGGAGGNAGSAGTTTTGTGGQVGSGITGGSGGGGGNTPNDTGGAGGGGGGYTPNYDVSLATKMYLGGGGGGGAGGSDSSVVAASTTGVTGANGGGIIVVAATTLTNNGTITAAGNTASTVTSANGDRVKGGGGGGAGGSILLSGNTLSLGSSTTSLGGSGTIRASTARTGGNGGDGVVAVSYGSTITGSSTPTATSSNVGYYPYGVYTSSPIATTNAVSLDKIRWEASPSAYGKIEMQTRTGNTTDPTDGTWEAWKPMTEHTNYETLDLADNHTLWTGTNATVSDGSVTRNVDGYEDEDEGTAGNTTKFVNTSAGAGYIESDSMSSTNISAYDYLTAWVYATASGNTVKIGFGESVATEQEELITINSANTWQKIYWDLSDIPAASRDDVNVVRITNLNNPWNTIHIDNIKAEKALTTSSGSTIASTPNNYIQYRAIFTTTNTAYQPQLYNVNIDYNDGFKVVQASDNNSVSMYNYTGSTQNVRLDVTVFGADLAEWYTVDDQSITSSDVVSITGQMDNNGVPILRKSNGRSDKNLIGIISTNAGQTLGIEKDGRRLLALAGRVPVKIDPNSPTIEAGDGITSSTTPGMGRKAGPGDVVIAKAAQPWKPGDGNTLFVIVSSTNSRDSYLASINDFELLNDAVTNTWSAVSKTTGDVVETAAAFGNVIAANIKAGAIVTKDFVAENFSAAVAKVQDLTANKVAINLITPIPGKTDVTVQIGSEATPSGQFIVQNASGSAVASIDNEGNATFSGTLYANDIKSKSLDEIHDLLTQVQTDQSLLKEASNWSILSSTDSAKIDELALANLYVTNQAAVNSLSVTNTLTIGPDMIFGSTINDQLLATNTIDTLTSPLQLQSLAMAPVEIMAGMFKIDTQGNVQITGNLAVSGKIQSSGLTLTENANATDSASLLKLQNTLGVDVASINSSGSAIFNNVSTQGLTIAGAGDATNSAIINGVITTNATAGNAIIPAGESYITIKNENVTNYSLVYVTPTSSTENYVLYVKNKKNGEFVVGFTNPLDIDVNFNWWIVRVAE